MSEFIEVLTKDGSYSLRSVFFQENFHSSFGALEETRLKFTSPSDLQRFKGESLNVLDICFGLGYNSASLFDELIKQKSFLNWYALEIDKKPLEYSLRNKSFLRLWTPKVKKIFESVYQTNYFEDQFFKCSLLWGDAREKINIIPSDIKFDLIYLDGFSPQKCPQVWTLEFLSKVTEKLNPQGYLITYSSSAAVRKTLRNFGLEIFTINPSINDRTFWSQGTVAISKFDSNKLEPNFNCKKLSKLSQMEEEHLLTKASIPYRDQDLNSSKEDIIKKRLDEQLLSNLESTSKWREKWGMTKSSPKS
ncbi:MAG: SAM-dependent methyltransferase [Prochlorococcus marinus CUG1431]|uniref:SAM-dependent methyltransferase n=1 Tax=Prochlorococcus marinus CUG1433 TaxID=2774506 RepID=A0A9D9BUN7_PROMR|nr:SAM-dependent methyltransferase [Prochlorococcus marinus CUG1433]MBO6980634.1 SAM-dependent methyltransferase [Prochlorococcus marinus CUG1431]